MKILVIPDIHGSTHWKKNYLENREKADACVFLGDYFDSFNESEKGISAALNMRDIFKTCSENDFILLGNHDAAYCGFAMGSPHVSGHQYGMQCYCEVLLENWERIKAGVKLGGWVFSHAGFSSVWLERSAFLLSFRGIKEFPKDGIDFANWLIENKDIRLLNYDDQDYSGFGNSPTQGPLWIRPDALLDSMLYDKQVVGHTESAMLVQRKGKKLVIVDSPEHSSFFILDTEKEYIFKEV